MVILSAHDLALLERRVTRMCVLRAGHVVAADTPENLRRRAGLPHRVHLELAEHANGEVRELMAAVEGLEGATVGRDGRTLLAEVPPEALLDVMGAQARHADAVVGLRVEEPPLDMIYEQLLEEE